MFKEGLTRFATYEYNAKAKDVGKRFIHLTNFSVNKHSKKFVKNSKEDKDGEGSKWSLTALRKYYEANGINSEKVLIFLFSSSMK
jgi:tubulin polyglutamylase TTLL4